MPELIRVVETCNQQETIAVGNLLGKQLRGGEVITLSGPLGSGKTSLAKGIGQALGIRPEIICSPTFILRAEHPGNLPLAHIDLYRLDSSDEIPKLGLFEQDPPGTVLLIEWPEKAGLHLPSERLMIELVPVGEEKRRLYFSMAGTSWPCLLKESI